MTPSLAKTQSTPGAPDRQRRRSDSRREVTTLAIIEAAESLFAQQGVDAVSLRQIGSAIGARNTAVVLYHFGDKEALIEAILAHRLPSFERRRAELAGEIAGSETDMVAVLRVLWLPLFEQRNTDGRRSYAAFLASLGRSQWGWVWSGAGLDLPVTLEFGDRIRQLMPPSAQPIYWERVIASTALITTVLGSIDRRADGDSGAELALFDDAIRMAAAALCAPVA